MLSKIPQHQGMLLVRHIKQFASTFKYTRNIVPVNTPIWERNKRELGELGQSLPITVMLRCVKSLAPTVEEVP